MSKKNDKKDMWMPWYLADYLADTLHLTRAQHGSYMLLLAAMWKSGGTLPNDPAQLAAIGKMTPAEWRKEGPVLMLFFKSCAGGICQKRLALEINKARGIIEQKSVAGKASAAKRWGNGDGNGGSNGNDNGTDNGSVTAGLRQDAPSPSPTQKAPAPAPPPRPSPSPTQESKASARKARAPLAATPGFLDFWSRYPKKVGKQEAERQWNLLAPDEDLRVTIIAALEEQKQSRQWSDPNFIKDPERWIKKRRWEDEVPRETDPIEEGNRRAAAAFVAGESQTTTEREFTDDEARISQ